MSFQDLVPAEILARRREAPMRPLSARSQPPSHARTGSLNEDADVLPSVDGVDEKTLQAWFRMADADGDGKIGDTEARDFFLRSGLSPTDLSMIWRLVKSPEVIARESKGLTERRFRLVLRLVALAQSPYDFSKENAAVALDPVWWRQLHAVPLPPPRFTLGGPVTPPSPPALPSLPGNHRHPEDTRPSTQVVEPTSSTLDPSAAFSEAQFNLASHQIPQQEVASSSDSGSQQTPEDGRRHFTHSFTAPAAVTAGPQPDSEEAHTPDIQRLNLELSLDALPAPASPYADDDLFGLAELSASARMASEGEDACEGVASQGLGSPSSSRAGPDLRAGEKHVLKIPSSVSASGLDSPEQSFMFPPGTNAGIPSSPLSINYAGSSKEDPMAVELRLPPLNPKLSSRLSMLCALWDGSLLAGPSLNGGALQYACQKPSSGTHGAPGEDSDASPASAIPAPRRKRVTAMLCDPLSGVVWLGDQEGYVTGFVVPKSSNNSDAASPRASSSRKVNEGKTHTLNSALHTLESVRPTWQWQAHKSGYVSAICVSPATGNVWTGSSRGHIRIWPLGAPPSSTLLGPSEPLSAREVRKHQGDRPHGSPVLFLAASADGSTVWSASRGTVLLWDAFCGGFLGVLAPSKKAGEETPNLGMGSYLVETAAQTLQDVGGSSAPVHDREGKQKINPTRGLSVDEQGRPLGLYPKDAASRLVADQENWAALSDRGVVDLVERVHLGGKNVVQGASKAVKLLSKFGKKVAKNINQSWREDDVDSERSMHGTTNQIGGTPAQAPLPHHLTHSISMPGLGGYRYQHQDPEEGIVLEESTVEAASRSTTPAGHSANIVHKVPPSAPPGGICGVVASLEGPVYVAYRSGRIERYTPAGRLKWVAQAGSGGSTTSISSFPGASSGSTPLGSFHLPSCVSLTALAVSGERIWVGTLAGALCVLCSDTGRTLKMWHAHRSAVIALSPCMDRVYSLGADGALNCWSAWIPTATAAATARTLWSEVARSTYKRASLPALALTWNVNEARPDPASSAVFRNLRTASRAVRPALVVVALQEIEMGGSSVALAAAKDALMYKMQEKGNTNAKFWAQSVLGALGDFKLVALRQLSGMLVLAYVRQDLSSNFVGEVATASVACGVLGVGGNKGAVAVEFSLHRHRIALLCSHFAAHQNAIEARNANYTMISRVLSFPRRAWLEDEALEEVGVRGNDDEDLNTNNNNPPETLLVSRTPSSSFTTSGHLNDQHLDADSTTAAHSASLVQADALKYAAVVIWAGDFNYRIDGHYEEVRERAVRAELDELLPLDQCRQQMALGRVFRGMREGPITFRPTYKFDKASPNPFAYDSTEKRRVPAWCDRVFFRGSPAFPSPEPAASERDLWSALENVPSDAVLVRCHEYGCWPDICDSDHKPVYSLLEVNLAITDWHKRRTLRTQILEHLNGKLGAERQGAPLELEGVVTLETQGGDTLSLPVPGNKMITLRNSLPRRICFRIKAGPLLGKGLSIFPMGGSLEPGQTRELILETHREAFPYGSKSAPVKGTLTVELRETIWPGKQKPVSITRPIVIHPPTYY